MPAANRLVPKNPLAVWGAELRDYREAAGYTQPKFAKKINYAISMISGVENAHLDPTDEFAQRCDDELGLKGALVRLLHRLRDVTTQEIYPDWFRPWPPEEQRATMLRSFELSVVPGLLQRESYTCGLLGADESAIAARLERQQILTRSDPLPPNVRCVLDESVLYRQVGSHEVMREQLQHLVAMVSSRLSVQVIPSRVHDGISGSFVLATLEDRSEVAYLETAARGMVTTSREDLAAVSDAWESIRTNALPLEDSLDLISRTAEQRWT